MTSLFIKTAGKVSRLPKVCYDQAKYLLPWVHSQYILKKNYK